MRGLKLESFSLTGWGVDRGDGSDILSAVRPLGARF